MTQITHDNHYVPQFYLKNWSIDGYSISVYYILVSNRNVPLWRNKSIENTACFKDLYTRIVDEDEIDDIEQWINNEFEAPAYEAIQKVKENRRLKAIDWQRLVKLLAVQQLRTPSTLNNLLAKWRIEMPIVFEQTLEKVKSDLENPDLILPKTINNIDNNLIPMKVKYDKNKSALSVSAIVGRGMYLFAIKHLLNKTASILNSHQWHIIRSADGIEWPTSDDPVICLNYYEKDRYDFKGGWGRKNGEIILPLTPHHLLYTQIGNDNKSCALDLNYKASLLFHKLIIEHAQRYVYAKEPIKGIQKLHPRKIDAELFKMEEQMYKDWHSAQIKSEKELLK